MSKICYTSLRRTVIFVLAAVLLLSVAVGIFLWMMTLEPAFFDENAKLGMPEAIPAERGYSFYPAEDICDVYICGNPEVNGKNIGVFLTNPESNDGIYIRVEIYSQNVVYDENGNKTQTLPDELLGKSGFIRPGEYVEYVKLKKAIKEHTPVVIKVATYLEETGLSNGFFYVTTVLSTEN